MGLADVTIDNVRCLEHVELTLHPQRNLIWGGNGSGKTSLLEALFLLGRGRSFRTRNSERLIRHGQPQLVVFGRTASVPTQSLGVQVSRAQGTVARISGAPAASLTELSQVFPVQVIDPGIHQLVEAGGYRRRRWLDWAVFHVEHSSFADHWTRYTRTIKQRNAALKSQPGQASIWDTELARLGESISEARDRLIVGLDPHWRSVVHSLTGLEVDLHYSRGWPQEAPLLQALKDSLARDRLRGVTHVGPHRGDVVLKVKGRAAREILSRGQQKLVAIAMTLAQLYLLRDAGAAAPTLLLDDPAAELDSHHLGVFIERVRELPCQLVLTSLQSDFGAFGAPDRVFHVEQGRVSAVG
ncbi:MAG TPA: DNA replication/repair protein RecF [Steroidobacteraceae bacterium]|nr:DNA replication/repair protein RecF [Steroidobacteraceae bacterium]